MSPGKPLSAHSQAPAGGAPPLHTHLMGIGGIGMSALAQVLAAGAGERPQAAHRPSTGSELAPSSPRGQALSGCDLHPSPITAKLQDLGIAFSAGHSPQHLEGVDRVVISDAIRPDNPELAHARSLGLPVLRRSQVVGELMRARRGVAVAGTHGKTTTTAMIGLILAQAGADPTVLIGGELPQFGGNARIGRGEFLVTEACEAYESYLDLEPEIAVITNIEAEHLDHHGSERSLLYSFARFAARVRPGGAMVFCADDANATSVAAAAGINAVSYAVGAAADYRAAEARDDDMGMSFTLTHPGGSTPVRLTIPGAHNIANAAAAIAACALAGVSVEESAATLAHFTGVLRRFQVARTAAGVTVVDDYAHHPTEIRAVIAAARPRCAGKLVIVFQPHLYTRTRDFLGQFAEALALGDLVVVTDIYAAREEPLPGVSGAAIVAAVSARGPAAGSGPPPRKKRRPSRAPSAGGKEEAFFWPQKDEVAGRLAPQLHAGDWVLVLGAGDIGSVAHDLVAILNRQGAGALGSAA